MALVRDPITGQYTFSDPASQVINTQTGQTANTLKAPPVTTPTSTPPPTMSPEALTTPTTPLNVPQYEAPPVPNTLDYDKTISQLLSDSPGATALQNEKKGIVDRISELFTKQGTEAARKAELETGAGIPDLSKTLNELITSIRQNNAGAFSASQSQEDRMAPTFAISGSQAQIERQRAVKNYGLAAAAEAVQGNIALANANVQRALDAEFKPLEAMIAYQKFLYDANRDELDREDKQRSEKLRIALDERTRILETQKSEREAAYNVLNVAAKYGAPASVLNAISGAKNYSEAVIAAGSYLQDPAAKYDIENARLDNLLKREQINKVQRETALIGQPTEKEKKEQADALRNAEASLPKMYDQVNIITALKDDPALSALVGPNAIARIGTGFRNATGQAQNFIGSIQKLTGGLTLQNLIDAKANGATFGALSIPELQLLAASASKIAGWEIHEDPKDPNSKVIGYNVSEKAFKEELDYIRTQTQRAIALKTGKVFDAEEEKFLDDLWGETQGSNTFSPSGFYSSTPIK